MHVRIHDWKFFFALNDKCVFIGTSTRAQSQLWDETTQKYTRMRRKLRECFLLPFAESTQSIKSLNINMDFRSYIYHTLWTCYFWRVKTREGLSLTYTVAVQKWSIVQSMSSRDSSCLSSSSECSFNGLFQQVKDSVEKTHWQTSGNRTAQP